MCERVTRPLLGGGGKDAFVIALRDNTAPFFTSEPAAQARAERPYAYVAEATDPDGDPLAFVLAVFPEGMDIDADSGEITWIPPTQGEEDIEEDVVVEVQDGEGGIATQRFTIEVQSANQPPDIISTPVTDAIVKVPYEYDVDAVDLDGDVLTYELTGAPAGMTIDPDSGLISWTPDAAGVPAVSVRVVDGRGGAAPQSYLINVTLDETSPVITITAPEDGLATTAGEIVIEGEIDEAGTVEVNGTPVPLDDQFRFTSDPLPLVEGDNTFNVTATDLPGNESTLTLTVVRDTTPPGLVISSPADAQAPARALLAAEPPLGASGTSETRQAGDRGPRPTYRTSRAFA